MWSNRSDPQAGRGGTRKPTSGAFPVIGAAVAAGHRISDIVALDDMALAGLGGAVKTRKHSVHRRTEAATSSLWIRERSQKQLT